MRALERRAVGTSGIEVSILGLGTAAFGGREGHAPGALTPPADDRECIAAIHQALDAGVNLVDTAPIHGFGRAEEIVGKAIHANRRDVVLASKCGLRFPRTPEQTPQRSLTATSIFRECESSLRRLRTDVIDLYFCHWPDPETPLEETMRAMVKLLDQGKIRAVGLCHFDLEQVAAARSFGPIHCIETPFSMLHRRAAEDLVPYCLEHRIGVFPFGCLARGLLTGKFAFDQRPSDARAKDPEFLGARFRRNLGIVESLRPIAHRAGRTVPQLVLQWVTAHPGVTSALFGANRPSQVLENIGAAGWSLDAGEREAIDAILAEADLAA
jgi:aryl-alcohol dehydrogenase-like predicted oxidoreductase